MLSKSSMATTSPQLPLTHGDLRLDPSRGEATRAGQPLPLSPNELVVLEHLLTARGRVVSAEELLFCVCDAPPNPFTTAIKTTIGRLRVKLGEPPLIETVRDSGYRI